jgi:hypothetical protein
MECHMLLLMKYMKNIELEFDYYIFNEDDYYFNDHNFDTYL